MRAFKFSNITEGRRSVENEKQIIKIIEDLPMRQQNLAKYMPFFELYALNRRSDKYSELDMGVLTLSLLSYLLYEGHLKEQGLTFEQIEAFLESVIEKTYGFTYEEEALTELTRYILDKLQNGGTPFSYEYYDVEEGVTKQTKLRYVSYKRDARLEKNFYRLTSAGIDFFLQTKEFGEESKISIQLILLRKLVDNEDFRSALSTLERINIEIKKEAKRKGEILEELSYGFTEGYEAYTKSIRKRLEDEQILFKDTLAYLQTLESEYLLKIEKSQITEKEICFKRFTVDMKMALTETVELHALLLDAVVDLRQKAEEMLFMRRKNIFKENFNFGHFLERSIRRNDTRGLAAAMKSLFHIQLPKQFTPERIDHLLLLKEGKNGAEEILENSSVEVLEVETLDEKVGARLSFNYELMLRELLLLVKEKEEITLEDYLKLLKVRYGEAVVTNYDLAPFMMSLTQNKGCMSDYKCFNLKAILQKDFKAPELEALYKKMILETESLSVFKESSLVVEVLKGTSIKEGPLEITNCKYYIKR